MEKKERELLKKHHPALLLSLNPRDTVIDYIFSKGVLTSTERKELLDCPEREDQADRLLRILPSKGKNAFAAFVRALAGSETNANKELADLLSKRPVPAVRTKSSAAAAKSAREGSRSKKAVSTSSKPTADAKTPVAQRYPPKPASPGDSVGKRRSSGKNLNSHLGTCPKCSVGELRLRKDGGNRFKIGCSNYPKCNAVISFLEFVTDVSPAQRKCKCGKIKVEMKFKRSKAPEGMKQGYKGCIHGNCDPVMQRNRWTIPKTGGDGSSSKAMGCAMSLTGNGGATSPGTLPAATSRCTIDAAIPSWLCYCRKPAIRLLTKKEGANRGRWFHKCATEKCEFWIWEDEHLHDRHTSSSSQQMHATSRSSQSLSSGSGSLNASGRGLKRSREQMNGGGGDGDSTPKRKPPTCSVCKKPGHTKPNCPSTSSAQ